MRRFMLVIDLFVILLCFFNMIAAVMAGKSPFIVVAWGVIAVLWFGATVLSSCDDY